MVPLSYSFGLVVYLCTINSLIWNGFVPLAAFWMAVAGTFATFAIAFHYNWFKFRT